MNRDDRRKLAKEGASKETVKKLDMYSQPCTITEAVQISRGVAEDVVTEYQRQTAPRHVSVALQLEILKKIIFDAGLSTEEKFHEMYIEEAKEFDAMQKKAYAEESVEEDEEEEEAVEDENPKMDPVVDDFAISIDRRD